MARHAAGGVRDELILAAARLVRAAARGLTVAPIGLVLPGSVLSACGCASNRDVCARANFPSWIGKATRCGGKVPCISPLLGKLGWLEFSKKGAEARRKRSTLRAR